MPVAIARQSGRLAALFDDKSLPLGDPMPAPAFQASDATTVTLADGRVVVSFGGCNYLGLASHPVVVEAVRAALDVFGLSATASRETTGNATPHETLEQELAEFLQVERSLLVPDGYIANIAACQGLAGLGVSVALIDQRGHASLADAARTAGLRVVRFDHARPESVAGAVRASRPAAAVVMTDGVFTADGEIAPISGLLREIGADDWLLVDDCHGLGTIGRGGRGSVAEAQLDDSRVVTTSSLAKGLGGAGGIVAGSDAFVAHCLRSSGYICTTPIAPAMAEGTRAALRVLRSEPGMLDTLHANADRLRSGLGSLGLIPESVRRTTPLAAFTVGDTPTMERLAADLLDDGFRVPLIRYPGGPAEAYFRLSVNAAHSAGQIDGLLRAFETRLPRQSRPATSAAFA
ncbi:MAG: aminotransferase class I/II-fold pyridoxal phosphate-dependent enzyme [Phycisphaerales bacterium JB041]